MKRIFIPVLVLILSSVAYSQAKWDVTQPDTPNRTVTLSVEEGTWMNLDVSPDGQWIAFDLLGDIYLVPIGGGDAKILREGHAYEVQPRFSPDGKRIAFTSDAGGGDNLWVMDVTGSNARQVTKENFRLINNPVWTPDGNYLVGRKHYTSERSLGAGELWIYHVQGGSGVQLTKRKNDQQDVGEPWVSPDGRYVYYSEDVYPGGYFQYNKDPNKQIYVIKRYDREEGDTETVIQVPGGAVRPQLSRDGKKIAYVRRVRTETVLYLFDPETGVHTPIYNQLSKDQQETWAIFGVYPNFNWLPDNQTVIIWANGKIQRINTKTGVATEIPFKATATHTIVDALQFKQNPDPETFTSKVIRDAKLSPDEKTLVFNAAGYLWSKAMPDGQPKRLTTSKDLEFQPSFSPDGKNLVYVTWNDERKGSINILPVKGGTPKVITSEQGIYENPAFSADGLKIAYEKSAGDRALGFTYTERAGIYWIEASGGQPHLVVDHGHNPQFNTSGDRIFFQTGGFIFGELDKSLRSITLMGEDEQTHLHSKYAGQFTLSSDAKWVAFDQSYNVYVMAFPAIGATFEISKDQTSLPMAKVTDDAGINVQWNQKGDKLSWSLGQNYYTIAVKDAFTFLEGSPESVKSIPKKTVEINLQLTTDRPKGLVALVGAKIITMRGEETLEDGVILIEGNRIKAVGKRTEVTIPPNAKVMDVSGKVIMPGLIDTHAHLGAFRYGISPQKEWPYYANLAFGITSTHDPSSNTQTALSQSEMVRSGTMVGPRIFTTGTILYGADGDFKAPIDSLKDARFAVERTKAYGAFSVKSYNQPRREQRQQVIKAARENEMMVYPEGGSTFFHNMTMILDGHTSIEHNVPIETLYEDVLQLWAASKTANTPTLIVSYGSVNAEYYWYQTTNVWENEHLLKYTPRSVIDQRSRHRTMIPMEEYANGYQLASQSIKKLSDRGVRICVGGHGQLQGLGVHWEMWNLQQGGMTNAQVLKAATLDGARYIGMEADLGSLEAGKLADLIVLDQDPLADIQNTQTLRYTMINGRLYDVATMNEIGNYNLPRTKFFWEFEGYSESFDWHEETEGFTRPHCVCGH